MMKIRRLTAVVLLGCTVAFSGNAAEKEAAPPPRFDLRLDGRPAAGKTVFFSYRAQAEKRYQMKLRGAQKNPPDRKETETLMLAGELTFLTAENGTAYQFKINAVELKRNGLTVKLPAGCVGRVCRIAVSGTDFQAEYADGPDNFSRLTPRADGSDKVMPPELRKILALVFGGTVGASPSEWFGAPRQNRAVGESWDADTAWLRAILAKRGIESTAAQFDARAAFKARREWMSIPVFLLNLKIQTFGVPGYTCTLDVSVDMPEKLEADSGPLHITSEASEVVDRLMPEDNPIFSGTKFQVTRLSSIEISFLPKN